MAPTGLVEVSMISRLSDTDDERLVQRAKSGCASSTECLLKKYRGFVERKAKSYFLAGADQDDVIQEGMIGLYKAIRDYRPDRLARFRSFAEMCVTRQIITAVKAATRSKHALLNDCVSLHRSLDSDEDSGCLIDVLGDCHATDPEQMLIQRRTLQCVRAAAHDELSPLEYRVLQGYLEGRTYQEMSGRLGRAPKAVDNALQRAKRKVGRRLSDEIYADACALN